MRRRSSGGVAYDQRTGFKVDGRKLRADGYTHAYTTDPDAVSPQDFVRPAGSDGRRWRSGPTSIDAIGADHVWGQARHDDLAHAGIGGNQLTGTQVQIAVQYGWAIAVTGDGGWGGL